MLHERSFPKTLALNADYQPLSYAPLSLWSWQDAVKAVFLDKVVVVRSYAELIRSPGFEMPLPAVVALRRYHQTPRMAAFTRMNLLLRDRHRCVYCGSKEELTFDHVVPRSRGGRLGFENAVVACATCNSKKGDKTPREAKMELPYRPYHPTTRELMRIGQEFPPDYDLSAFVDFCYYSTRLQDEDH